ncbi:hypothetical protein CSIM01_01742 [Colletotrichum simmondsii]|uniref:DUF3669 domain-containing protein n=1 Tax=Colletotrichum simmondsii TaxID=703756 RepID=A0A135T496_9PEZI|nr:hypothetical protein CSIM01_01742 [Colletotrichum simmondsii]
MDEQTPNTSNFTTAHSTLPLETIGKGFCGSIWSAPTSNLAIKREDGGPGRSIAHEHTMHRHIIQSLDSTSRLQLNVPHCEGYLKPNAVVWDQILPRFPPGYTGCNALISEKIPPHLEMFMEALGMELHGYAAAMADALAFLHWTAKVDANDVEFVLAAPRTPQTSLDEEASKSALGPAVFHSNAFGSHAMWILDFDCCRVMTMDDNGIRQACRSFWRNDPYYPRPGSDNTKDKELRATFRSQFLKSSDGILKGEEDDVRQLPIRLIECIEETKGRFTKGTDFW